jgi:hypothetical protein
MFEIIGLLLGAAVFFGLSALLGAIFGFAAGWLFRRRPARSLRALLMATVPPICAIYMAICLVLFPGRSLFGDISEPLPHGYILKALGKMPEYGDIEGPTPRDEPQFAGWIGKVDLDGTTLFGAYSSLFAHPEYDPAPVLKPCCFAFDTRSGKVLNFDSINQMEGFAGRRLTLVEVQYFRSQEPAHIRLMRIENFILLSPPCVLMLGAWVLLFLWRRDMHDAVTI